MSLLDLTLVFNEGRNREELKRDVTRGQQDGKMKRLSGSVQKQFSWERSQGFLTFTNRCFFNALNIYLFLVYVAPYNAANYKTVH